MARRREDRKKRKENVQYGQCAILYRTNAQSRLIEERFVLDGLPYQIFGGVNFYARKEIRDILAYLKTIHNGADDVAVQRLINIPKRGIGATTIARVQEYANERNITFFSALQESDQIMSLGKSSTKLNAFVTQIEAFRGKEAYFGIAELLRDIIDTVAYEEYLKNQNDDDVEDRMENIQELINKAVVYEQSHDEINLGEFLEEISLVSDLDRLEEDKDRIVLMTLHSAKGLEFPHVYLAGMEDGLFPSYMTITSDDPTEIEEERRLAYVGITRAMDDLTLSYAKMRMNHGETQYNPVSRFVREIPNTLLDNTIPGTKYREEQFDLRPKAILRPRVTPAENKPYIAQGISGLNKIAGLSKGCEIDVLGELEYSVGNSVKHTKYGEGIVEKIEKETRDYKVTVNFEKAGTKIMYASFAKLQRL